MVKTPKTRTSYVYNRYGLTESVSTYEVVYAANGSLATRDGTEYLRESYSYQTSAGSRIFGATVKKTDTLGRLTRYYYEAESGRLNAEIVKGNRANGYFCCFAMLLPKYFVKIWEVILPRMGLI